MKVKKEFLEDIKELHGVGCAPYEIGSRQNQSAVYSLFSYLGIPRSRLHDCCGKFGGEYFVDVPNIFRDFNADAEDENSYDFYYTDEYIGAIIKSGANVVYRLGVTIECGSKKYRIDPPSDNLKWAKICEHIIAHYNKGWANGFNYNIEYWEIWNEPENPNMWTGTREQFYELYKVASKYLKSKFPEVKIGGYGSCGFYASFRENESDFNKSFIPYFRDFLQCLKDSDCSLDFFTWHIYAGKASEIVQSAEFVRATLDEFGFTKTESHLNEWNYFDANDGYRHIDDIKGAGFVSTALVTMQNTSIDLAQYYCASYSTFYNGLMDMRMETYTPIAYVFKVFSDLFKLKHRIRIDNKNSFQVLGSADDGKCEILISNFKGCDQVVDLDFTEFGDRVDAYVYRLKEQGGFVLTDVVFGKDKIIVYQDEVLMIKFRY